MIALAAAIGALYIASPVIQSGDGRIVIYEADSLVKQQNLDISEYGTIVNGFPCYRVGPRTISRYPWGTAVVAAPIVGGLDALGALVGHNPSSTFRERAARGFEKTVAAIIAALGILAMMQLVRALTGRVEPALLGGVILGLGTAMWSTVSRGLWQHGPLILVVTLALLALLRARDDERLRTYALAGALFGACFGIRPSAVYFIALAGLVALVWSRRGFAAFAVACALAIGVVILGNLHEYDSIMNPFYFPPGGATFIGEGLRPGFWNALAGTSISPARGLFAFSPFLGLALIAPLLLRRRPNAVEAMSYAAIFATWFTVANTLDWPGGWSYGPRLLVDTTPYFAILLAPLLDLVTRSGWRANRTAQVVAALLAIGVAWGAFTNGRGALSWSTQLWNMTPVSADYRYTNDRYFDWSDAPFFRHTGTTQRDIYPYDTPDPNVAPGTACAAG